MTSLRLTLVQSTTLLLVLVTSQFLSVLLEITEDKVPPQMENGNGFTAENSVVAIPPPAELKPLINVPDKLLMGPGPANVSPRVLEVNYK